MDVAIEKGELEEAVAMSDQLAQREVRCLQGSIVIFSYLMLILLCSLAAGWPQLLTAIPMSNKSR